MPDYISSMFSTMGITPWHGKGVVLSEEAITAEQAIEEAGLDWEVKLHPITVAGVLVENYYATVRSDNQAVLGIVGSRYVPVQNRDLFTFFDPVVDREKGAWYHTGGSLLEGRKVWLLAKVPGDFYVAGVPDDLVENYILLASSHDGSLHVTAKSTPVRVCCNNTLSMALAHASTTVQIRHTASAKYELAAAHTVLGLATKRSQALKEAAEALVSLKVTRKFFKGFVRALFPSVKERQGEEASAKAIHHREAVELLFSTQLNNLPGMAGTGWSLYNAVTEYVDHKMPARRGTDTLDRAWFGSGEELKLKAFRLLAEQIDPNFEEA